MEITKQDIFNAAGELQFDTGVRAWNAWVTITERHVPKELWPTVRNVGWRTLAVLYRASGMDCDKAVAEAIRDKSNAVRTKYGSIG